MVSGLEEVLNVKLPADLDSEEARLFLVELVSRLLPVLKLDDSNPEKRWGGVRGGAGESAVSQSSD